jgi:Na+/H+ antiporter NhaB
VIPLRAATKAASFSQLGLTKSSTKPIEETFMNRLLIVVGLIVVGVIGLGFYFGYFRISSDSSDGSSHITLTVDQKKIQEDEKKAMEKVRGKE